MLLPTLNPRPRPLRTHPLSRAGVSHGLGLCALALSRPGDVVVAECPTYFLVPPIFRDHHLVLQHVPTDQHGMDVEALEAWMRADPAHRWVLCVVEL